MKSHNDFMQVALEEASKADKDVPVAALIVKNGEIISLAHNKKELMNDVTAHAEILAIKDAEKKQNNWRLEDCIMYVTLEPCPMCATAIVNSRIKEVYFGAYDNLYGALGSKMNMPAILNSDLKVKGGICEEACSMLLKNFWRKNG